MSNAMTTVNPAAALATMFAGGGNPFLQTAKDLGGGGTFGRFNGKTGSYLIGDATIEGDTAAVFEFQDAKLQWLGFDPDNNPKRGPEAAIAKGEVLEEPDRSDTDIRWARQMVVPIVTEDGNRVLYSSKADYGSRPIIKLMTEYGNHVLRKIDADGRYMLPMVSMSAAPKSRYVDQVENGVKRKVKAEFFVEIFKIEDWLTVDDVANWTAGASSDEPEMKTVNHREAEDIEILPPETASAPVQAAPARPTSKFRK